jgi:hypothetical protein
MRRRIHCILYCHTFILHTPLIHTSWGALGDCLSTLRPYSDAGCACAVSLRPSTGVKETYKET